MVNARWLFVASCISLVTSAFTFIVRGDILQSLGNDFALTQEQKGAIEGAVFLGMACSMLLGGFICDALGMKNIMRLAFASHLSGVLGTIFAPHSNISFYWLYSASFIMGCGNGFVETAINPLAATLYPTRKTHYLNILHAWWPGGLVIGGILAKFVGGGIDLGFVTVAGLAAGWKASLILILVPCLVYGAMLIGQRFPQTERVASGVSTGEMFKEALRPAFLLLAFCMLLTAATELGPQKWQESVMTRTAGVSGTLILVYTSSMMFTLRHFAGSIAHAISPIGMLLTSSVLAAVGLYLLSTATNATEAFLYATIFGLGIAYFWPTMLGVTSERFPKGGALALCLMGSMGNLSISQVLPIMGSFFDEYAIQKVKEDPKVASFVLVDKDGQTTLDQARIAQIDLLTPLSSEALQQIPSDTPAGQVLREITAAKLTSEQRAVLAEKLQAKGYPDVAKLVQEGKLDPTQLTTPQTKALNAALAEIEKTDAQKEIERMRKVVGEAEAYGASMAFRKVALLPVVLIVLFSLMAIDAKRRGGYDAVVKMAMLTPHTPAEPPETPY